MRLYLKTGLLIAGALTIGIFITAAGISSAKSENPKNSVLSIGHDIYTPEMMMESAVIKPAGIPSQLRVDISYIKGSEKLKNLPVVYITDGHWRRADHKYFHYLSYKKLIPSVLVVGIGYPEGYDVQRIRMKDLVSNPSPFLKSIKDDVIPFVEKKFSCDQAKRTLVGASAGGHFSLYAFIESLRSGDVPFSGVVGSSAYLPDFDVDNITEGISAYKGSAPVFLYMSYGGSEGPSLPYADVNICEPNRKLFEAVDKLKAGKISFVHRFNPDADHYTNSRITFVEGVRLAYAKGARFPYDFNDIAYGSFRYGFDSRTEMYDWESNGALRKMVYSVKDSESSAQGAFVLETDFTKDREGGAGTTFDHVEDLSGKPISFRIHVPRSFEGKKYEALLTCMSTYGWKEDRSKPVVINKAGWITLTHKFEKTENGDARQARGFGILIRKGLSSPAVKGSLVIDEVSW